MLLEFILRHDADEVLEGSIITTFGLTKWQDKVGLIPPGVKELSTPISVPEEEHTCGPRFTNLQSFPISFTTPQHNS